MATASYIFDDDHEIAATSPLDLTPYPTTDEMAAAPAPRADPPREMRPVDYAWAAFLVGLALGWLVAMTLVAYHIATEGL